MEIPVAESMPSIIDLCAASEDSPTTEEAPYHATTRLISDGDVPREEVQILTAPLRIDSIESDDSGFCISDMWDRRKQAISASLLDYNNKEREGQTYENLSSID
jgi:hypothetical protein